MATTETTQSSYLTATEDWVPEVEITTKNATTGVLEPATGLTGVTFLVSLTRGGSAISGLGSISASERGTTGIYYAVVDLATLTTNLPAATYPDGTKVWLGLAKTGDIASRWWPKIIRRHRVGDG